MVFQNIKKRRRMKKIIWVSFLLYQIQFVSSTSSSVPSSSTNNIQGYSYSYNDVKSSSSTASEDEVLDSSKSSSSSLPVNYEENDSSTMQQSHEEENDRRQQQYSNDENIDEQGRNNIIIREFESEDIKSTITSSGTGNNSRNSHHTYSENSSSSSENNHSNMQNSKIENIIESEDNHDFDNENEQNEEEEEDEVLEEETMILDDEDDMEESISSDGGEDGDSDDEYEVEDDDGDDDDGEDNESNENYTEEDEDEGLYQSSQQYQTLTHRIRQTHHMEDELEKPNDRSKRRVGSYKSTSSQPSQSFTSLSSTSSSSSSSSSQPLRTLKKLQAMLEDTDYATSSTSENRSSSEAYYEQAQQPHHVNQYERSRDLSHLPDSEDSTNEEEIEVTDKLWTSKDRSKYRKQQQRSRRIEYERKQYLMQQRKKLEEERQKQMKRQRQQQQQQSAMSDDDSTGTDGIDDTDDGLGYTLPNLPVYFSDAESDSLDLDSSTSMNSGSNMNNAVKGKSQGQSDLSFSVASTPNKSAQMSMPIQQQPQPQQQYHQQSYQNYPQSPPVQQGQGPPYQYQTQQQQQHMQQQIYQQPQQQQSSSQAGSTNPSMYPQQQQPLTQQQQYNNPNQQYNSPNQQYPYHSQPIQQQQQRGTTYNHPPQQYHFNNQSGYNPMNIQQQQGQYNQWHQAQGYGPHPSPDYYNQQQYSPQQNSYFNQQQQQQQQKFYPQPFITKPQSQLQNKSLNQSLSSSNIQSSSKNGTDNPTQSSTNKLQQVQQIVQTTNVAVTNESKPKEEISSQIVSGSTYTSTPRSSRITFDSIQKMFFFAMSNMFLCYCAVSPRTLELNDYNQSFKNNVHTALLVFIAPILELILVVEKKENDLNSLISTFYVSATFGTFFALMLEIGLTTLIRLAVFCIWEPSIFSLTPDVPLIVLPWTLRDHKYRPKRITLFAADFTTTCIAAPCIEEYVKFKVMQLSTNLPRNFRHRKLGKNEMNRKKRRMKRRRKNYVIEEIPRKANEDQVKNINSYVSHMLAASLGMKLADSVKRTMMYTKQGDVHQKFYATMRGFYPVHELCGTMTALELAKRDILGLDIALWRLLFPAVFIHGMANLKGMKPLFKWNSKTPWTELQFSESWWNLAEDSTLSQMFTKGFAKFMWFVILARVFGYCVKNYYMITRRAIKRTTIFAGKNAAFNAEIKAADALKKLKKDSTK